MVIFLGDLEEKTTVVSYLRGQAKKSLEINRTFLGYPTGQEDYTFTSEDGTAWRYNEATGEYAEQYDYQVNRRISPKAQTNQISSAINPFGWKPVTCSNYSLLPIRFGRGQHVIVPPKREQLSATWWIPEP